MKVIDLTGQRFTRLLVVKRGPNSNQGQATWVCVCECGHETLVNSGNLRSGGTKSCGCLSKEKARVCMTNLRESIKNRTAEQMVGHKFNRLTVVQPYDIEPGQGAQRWLCACDCGKPVTARTAALVSGMTKSCGCWRADSRKKELGVCARNHLLATYRCTAKRKGHPWGLLDDEFFALTVLPCHYCGASPSERKDSKRYNGDYVCNGVDRQDNKLGYTTGNCLPCCKDCNRMKGTMAYDDFLTYLRRAGKFQQKLEGMPSLSKGQAA